MLLCCCHPQLLDTTSVNACGKNYSRCGVVANGDKFRIPRVGRVLLRKSAPLAEEVPRWLQT